MEKNETYWINLIGKHLSGNISLDEDRELQAWKNASESNQNTYTEFKQIWEQSFPSTALLNIDREAGWANISKAVNREDGRQSPPVVHRKIARWNASKWAVAAAVVLITTFFFLFILPTRTPMANIIAIQSDAHTKEKTILPDGSIVWLNKNSTMEFESSRTYRILRLTGEAYFEVEPDPEKPFQVHALQSITEVVGTEFNLRVDPESNKVELMVTEGKVRFFRKEQKTEKLQLVATEGAVLSKESPYPVKRSFRNLTNVLSWKTNTLIFEHTPIRQVIQDLEKHYLVDIEIENTAIMNCTYLATFSNDSLSEILKAIEFSLPVKVRQEDGKYFITGTPCSENQ